VCQCEQCPELALERTQTVFGEGHPNARIMLLGEAPGQKEDETGRPFVGKAGNLLDNMIEAAGWARADLFICNVLKCRPPGNRNPTNEEADNCRGFLNLQIKLIEPEYIICLGKVALYHLFGLQGMEFDKLRIANYRETIHTDVIPGRKVVVTYHPSYLLRNNEAKGEAWKDIQMVLSDMG
tara:strand:+ start:13283 stop:13825 length:543 start_codon:yes stop_codon:yes gene_type:complete